MANHPLPLIARSRGFPVLRVSPGDKSALTPVEATYASWTKNAREDGSRDRMGKAPGTNGAGGEGMTSKRGTSALKPTVDTLARLLASTSNRRSCARLPATTAYNPGAISPSMPPTSAPRQQGGKRGGEQGLNITPQACPC